VSWCFEVSVRLMLNCKVSNCTIPDWAHICSEARYAPNQVWARESASPTHGNPIRDCVHHLFVLNVGDAPRLLKQATTRSCLLHSSSLEEPAPDEISIALPPYILNMRIWFLVTWRLLRWVRWSGRSKHPQSGCFLPPFHRYRDFSGQNSVRGGCIQRQLSQILAILL